MVAPFPLREQLEYFEYSNADRETLAELRPLLEKHADALVSDFYRHLLFFASTRTFLKSEEVKCRLLLKQKACFAKAIRKSAHPFRTAPIVSILVLDRGRRLMNDADGSSAHCAGLVATAADTESEGSARLDGDILSPLSKASANSRLNCSTMPAGSKSRGFIGTAHERSHSCRGGERLAKSGPTRAASNPQNTTSSANESDVAPWRSSRLCGAMNDGPWSMVSRPDRRCPRASCGLARQGTRRSLERVAIELRQKGKHTDIRRAPGRTDWVG